MEEFACRRKLFPLSKERNLLGRRSRFSFAFAFSMDSVTPLDGCDPDRERPAFGMKSGPPHSTGNWPELLAIQGQIPITKVGQVDPLNRHARAARGAVEHQIAIWGKSRLSGLSQTQSG